MTILDNVFSGERSVTALLAGMFASSAVLIRPGERGAYDPVADTFALSENTEVPVKFFQTTAKRNVLTHVDGVQIEAGDLVGSIPAYQIPFSIRRESDCLRLHGTTYIIYSTEDIRSGDESALVRVLCRKTSQ